MSPGFSNKGQFRFRGQCCRVSSDTVFSLKRPPPWQMDLEFFSFSLGWGGGGHRRLSSES